MGHKIKNDMDKNEYRFINETIKKKPLDKKKFFCKLAAIAGSGLLFGSCAAAACAGMFPFFAEQFGVVYPGAGALRIVTPTPAAEKQTQIPIPLTEAVSCANPLDNYEATYSEVLRVSENPRKALITMKGLSSDQHILDDSQLSYSSSQGIIFLETAADFYVLTYGDKFNDIHDLEATFADGTTAVAQICKEDAQTGLLVAKISKGELSPKTLGELYVADLGASTELPKNSPVIAIGCPAGDNDAVDYGIITSISGKQQMADVEYNILATDMHGHPGGSGVLLDFSGNVVGVIIKQEPDSTGTVRAWPISQIRPLIERLVNQDATNYTGIYGTGITSAQSDRLHLPMGVYVDYVDENSPAQTAGIQNGDIITRADHHPVKTMQEYNRIIQNAEPHQEIKVTVSRNSSGGEQVKLDFKLNIEER